MKKERFIGTKEKKYQGEVMNEKPIEQKSKTENEEVVNATADDLLAAIELVTSKHRQEWQKPEFTIVPKKEVAR